jgi:carbonic anhydrase
MSHGTFALVLGCMDGRCQEKAVQYAKENLGANFIDTVTEPGIDGILSGSKHPVYAAAGEVVRAQDFIRRKAMVSAKGHGAKKCLILAHNECAGNPVSHEQHLKDLKKAVATVRGWGLFDEIKTAVFNPEWELVSAD